MKRTPVRAELAERITALMGLLVVEFGFDLHFQIRGRDGLVAASNAADGYVPPLVVGESPPVSP